MSPVAALEVDVRLELDRFALEVAFVTGSPVTGIFGASGSGKTSLLETIAGLRRGARGRISLGDETWLDERRFLPTEDRHVGYLPQEGLLFPHWDVRRNLLAGSRRARRAGHDPDERLGTVVELLELEPLLARDVTTLSGGERQRVALGRALCSGPRLLLLDEPLSSLDLRLRYKLLPFLRRVRHELTVPMLLVSHDPVEVQALCDELIVLDRGHQVARGEPRAVLRDPKVFPLAEREGFENVVTGRVTELGRNTCTVRLGESGVELVTQRGDVRVGDEVLVGVLASEILIAGERPRRISARNVVPATVVELRPADGWELVTAELEPGLPPLVVEVTEASASELGLEPRRRVHLVVKAASCRLLGGG